jgi:hypothetical protein
MKARRTRINVRDVPVLVSPALEIALLTKVALHPDMEFGTR